MAKKKSKVAKRSAGRAAAAKPKKVSWLAKGYPVLSSITVLDQCAQAIDWYKKVLGAKQRLRMDMPGGLVAHCELGFGDAVLMLGSAMPPQNAPKKACLSVYVKDCDATYKAALSAGGRSIQEPADQFYGDRNYAVDDPEGHRWYFAEHVREMTPEDMKAAMKSA